MDITDYDAIWDDLKMLGPVSLPANCGPKYTAPEIVTSFKDLNFPMLWRRHLLYIGAHRE